MTTVLLPVYALDPLRDSRHRDARAARDLADWLAWLELGNKAARTLDTYERQAAALLRAFPDVAFDDFDDGHLSHVLKTFPPKSRHLVKAAWNNWFGWGYRTRRLPGNPVDLLPAIKYRPPRNYDIFTEAEADALCALPSPDGQLMTLLLWAGLRRSEARLLTGKRLDLARGQVLVLEGAKLSKERVVPMVDRLATASAELLQLEGIGPDDHVWGTRPGGGRVRRETPMSNTSFDNWWKHTLENAGVRHRRPHLARHTFASRLRDLGVPMEDIKDHLGHDSIRTTVDVYAHSDVESRARRLREAVGDL